jgi:serine/threonine protein kinase
VHSDIKPGNILIARGPEKERQQAAAVLEERQQAAAVLGERQPAAVLGERQQAAAGGGERQQVASLVDAISPDCVRVADFGLGRRAIGRAEDSILQSGSLSLEDGQRISGTLAYMSPEQREGHPVDARTDLYAVGVVLHEMLTGVLPQGGDSPSTLRPGLPRWVDELFHRCYTHRDRRFESASQMHEFIQRHWHAARAWRSGKELSSSDGHSPGTRRAGSRLVCIACNGVVECGDQFCIHCGRQLVNEVLRCPSCHGFVGQQDNFCILCGIDLRQTV